MKRPYRVFANLDGMWTEVQVFASSDEEATNLLSAKIAAISGKVAGFNGGDAVKRKTDGKAQT